MDIQFSDKFVRSLKKHSSLKAEVKNKVDMITENPVALGEPLKGSLRGYYSFPVKKNFILIYLYCYICRKKGDDKIVICKDCDNQRDDTIRFVALGPHYDTYKAAAK
jgi:mRNA-degrading endonuclease YafQ of YafQ-DinJ toxin-antitoxin module